MGRDPDPAVTCDVCIKIDADGAPFDACPPPAVSR